MAEALLSRSTTIPEEILNPIDPVAGYCVMVIRVKDYNNKPIPGLRVTCNAGTQALNYNTNEKGAVMFTINNGMANIFLNNFLNNNVRICDYGARWVNSVEAPVGTVQYINYQLNRLNTTKLTSGNYNYIFKDAKFINLNISGGGGGGGGGVYLNYGSTRPMYGSGYGGAGGSGYTAVKNNISVSNATIYSLSIGSGGHGGSGRSGHTSSDGTVASKGGTGGTTRFSNILSANGGGGGSAGGHDWSSGFYNGSKGTGGSGASGGAGSSSTGSNGSTGWINIKFKY